MISSLRVSGDVLVEPVKFTNNGIIPFLGLTPIPVGAVVIVALASTFKLYVVRSAPSNIKLIGFDYKINKYIIKSSLSPVL